ncbi:MAG: hypothetical protein AAF569_00505 [Pseudomonadota bacterium]
MGDEYETKFEVSVFRDEETGNITKQFYRVASTGKFGRLDGPSRTFYDPKTGNKLEEFHDMLNMLHRDENEGSAHRKYHPETQRLIYEAYYQYDEKSRSGNKPAEIEYDPYTGEATKWQFFRGGRRYTPPEEANIPPPPAL